MALIAFVFPGQGAQKAGMGKSLCATYPAARAVFDQLEELRPGTRELCFEGSEAELSETANTQPCLYAVELAAVSALAAKGIYPDACAGFSLGEISALAASGAISLEEGFRLVSLRGELMQREAEKVEGAMAAVLKLNAATVEALCVAHGVYPVNYNCPGQIAVSGEKAKMPAFLAAVKAAGGRGVPLKVKGAFHSPYMAEAADQFRAALSQVAFQAPKGLLYSNKTGLPYDQSFTDTLADQIKSPVRWQAVIEDMRKGGIGTFIEVGPGRTLAGLIGKIDASATVLSVEDTESLERTVRALC